MRSMLIVIVSFSMGVAAATLLGSGPLLPATTSVDAADATVPQEAEVPFGPEDLLAEAEVYDQQADLIETEVMQYRRKAAAITPLMDPKGFRRAGLMTAASAKSKAVAELRQLAAHHRAEGNRMMAKQSAPK
jgi:hypothetical protein